MSDFDKLVKKFKQDLQRLDLLSDSPEERIKISEAVRAINEFAKPEIDPRERDKNEIREIFSDFPRDCKYSNSYIYNQYCCRSPFPLSPKSFWHLFRQVFQVVQVRFREKKIPVSGIAFKYQLRKEKKNLYEVKP